ncbi:MAG: arsenate reductase family protein [Clostridium sp.]|nr:arsenate reductase family protein [Clostridium sp.]
MEFIEKDIVKETPTQEELVNLINRSGLEIKKFFNTSGKLYKEMNLKDKIKDMNIVEAAKILSSNGMLIKRPMLLSDDFVILGFKEDLYENIK